jgi:uncharacterized delta-60 repeat protein
MRSHAPTTEVSAFPFFASVVSRAAAKTVALFSVLLLVAGAAAVRGQSALDGFDPNAISPNPNANGTVRIIVVQPDGKILLGGEFTTLSPNGGPAVVRNRIARLNPDGTLDTAFDPNANGIVLSMAVQAEGKILVGGSFTSIGGQTRNGIARLDATTGLADSFNPNAVGNVYSIVVQKDGKVLVGGFFTSIGGQPRSHIARLDPTTGLADSFNPNPNDMQGVVDAITTQADGKILVGGTFTSIGGQARNRIARLDPATGLADSFDPNANSPVGAIAVQADGKILAGGIFTSIGGQARNRIARLDPTTGLADSFDPGADGNPLSIVVQADGKILVGGFFTGIGGQPRNYIARLDPATGLADSFDPNPNGSVVCSIALQPDGKVLVGGAFTTVAPNGGANVTRHRVARFEIDGRVDQTLDLNFLEGLYYVSAIAVQPDGKILIGGGFISVLGVTRHHLARINTDGTLDLTFDPNPDDGVNAIAVQPDGKVLVGGIFTSIGGQTRHHMARLDPVTGQADSFDPKVSPTFPFGEGVGIIALQPDGKILVAGSFSSVGGQTRHNIARLDPSTGQADSFDPNADGNGVFTIALQADGKILAGGNFNNIGGQVRNHIARLDPATGLADTFDPNANARVDSIAVQPDGKILVGGGFDDFNGAITIGGQTRNRIARLDPATGFADSFNPNAEGPVYAIAVQADGKIVTGGAFRNIGGQPRNHLARLDPTTGLADQFDPNVNQAIQTMAVQADGKLLAGGTFQTVGGQTRLDFVRLSNDTAALQNLAVTQTAITWKRGGSSPQFTRVTFEYSPDNVNYTFLGNGTADGSNWTLAGLNFSIEQNFYIRARGYQISGRGSGSITESIRNAFLFPASQAINVSTRMRVQTGDNVGIGGFIITGSSTKHVLIRALGPSLTQIGVPSVLADPVLELHGPGTFVTVSNDNWRDDPVQAALIQATGIPPTNDLESAIEARLFPGPYTAVVKGKNNATGIALVEVYDLSPAPAEKLANLSTRAFVDTGDNRVIAGFILGNNAGDGRVIVRGLGPSLTAAGIANALANPTLELRNMNGVLLASNNNWQDNAAQATELTAAGLAPTNPLESGIAATLPPGPYTVLLAGLNNGTGIGLVEVYDRGAP